MKINILPQAVSVSDYHELQSIQSSLRLVLPEVSVIEVGFKRNQYVGLIFEGSITDPKNKVQFDLIKETVK